MRNRRTIIGVACLLLICPLLDVNAWVFQNPFSAPGNKACFHDRTLIDTASKMRLFPRCSITAHGGDELTVLARDKYADVIRNFTLDKETMFLLIEGKDIKKGRKVKQVDRKYYDEHWTHSVQVTYCANCGYAFSVTFLP